MELILSIHKDKIIRNIIKLKFIRFLIVGVFNTSINFSIFSLLLIYFKFVYFIAGAIGFFSGAISGFILNKFWTFKSSVSIKTGLLKYLLVQLLCLVAHISTQIGVTEFVGVPELFSQIFGIFITTFMNFYLINKLVFK